MGCVQSSQTRRSARAKQARRQKLYEQQNFHPKPQKTNPPVKSNDECNSAQSPKEVGGSMITAAHMNNLSSPSSSSGTPVTNTNSGNNEEIQFRRQHFDRNSMLRHSKKRRKSSASASPNVTINNKSMSVAATPNRLKAVDSSELKKALSSPSPPPSSSRPTSSSLTIRAHENRATASLSSSKNDESKQRIPNSTSPEHLQRQNSGRLI